MSTYFRNVSACRVTVVARNPKDIGHCFIAGATMAA